MAQNSFRLRASEHATSEEQFLSLVGPLVLDMLPRDLLWDRLFIIESAPGAGKTTILRLFTPNALRSLERLKYQDAYKPLFEHLKSLGVLTQEGPTVNGVLINCREQYATIQDLPIDSPTQLRMFFGLLDSRINLLTLRSILRLHNLTYPNDANLIEIRPNDRAKTNKPLTGEQIYERASEAERILTESINSLVGSSDVSSHLMNTLQVARVFSTSDIFVNGTLSKERMLFMFDDVHELASEQRKALRRDLEQRDLHIARWIAQRSQAVGPVELLDFARTEGRDFEQIQIEQWAQETKGRGNKFSDLLGEIGDRRAQRAQIGVESLESCLGSSLNTKQEIERVKEACQKAKEQAITLANDRQKFSEWISDQNASEETESISEALKWRRISLMIERVERPSSRKQLPLDMPLPASQLEEKDASDIQTAIELFLSREYRLPFYYGIKRVKQLSSWNIEQFLRVAGDLFEQFLASITLSRRSIVQLSATQQDTLIRNISQKRITTLAREVPFGSDVQKLVRAIGSYCQNETYRPTAPYAPGVTGVGISISETEKLREAALTSEQTPIGRLARTLASAIANNVLEIRTDVKVKGGTWTIFFLNRLYCPAFELPLEYSGYRERIGTDQLMSWMIQGYEYQRPARLNI